MGRRDVAAVVARYYSVVAFIEWETEVRRWNSNTSSYVELSFGHIPCMQPTALKTCLLAALMDCDVTKYNFVQLC